MRCAWPHDDRRLRRIWLENQIRRVTSGGLTVGFGGGATREANERVGKDMVSEISLAHAVVLINLTTVRTTEIVSPT